MCKLQSGTTPMTILSLKDHIVSISIHIKYETGFGLQIIVIFYSLQLGIFQSS